ncbi:MAG: hypothetical protein ACP5JB_00040 [candidate division WOR-3 bacterium]|jgi:hypothetical protein
MKPNGTLKAALLLVIFSGGALGYLYLHAVSIRVTRELAKVDTERKLAAERVDVLGVELERMKGFCRLESLWVASQERFVADRRGEPPAETVRTQAVVLGKPTQEAVAINCRSGR